MYSERLRATAKLVARWLIKGELRLVHLLLELVRRCGPDDTAATPDLFLLLPGPWPTADEDEAATPAAVCSTDMALDSLPTISFISFSPLGNPCTMACSFAAFSRASTKSS
jgi:hypothetical protein